LNANTVATERATPEQVKQLRDLAVKVRRTIPRFLTSAETDALIREYGQLPRHGIVPTADTADNRKAKRRGGRGKGGQGQAAA
jgi:hypothetical protein